MTDNPFYLEKPSEDQAYPELNKPGWYWFDEGYHCYGPFKYRRSALRHLEVYCMEVL